MPETPRQERGPLTYPTLVCTQEELKGRPPPYPSPHLAQGATGQNGKDPAIPDCSRVTPGQGRVSPEQGGTLLGGRTPRSHLAKQPRLERATAGPAASCVEAAQNEKAGPLFQNDQSIKTRAGPS